MVSLLFPKKSGGGSTVSGEDSAEQSTVVFSTDPSDYDVIGAIGHGAYATVYAAEYQADTDDASANAQCRSVVIKVIELETKSDSSEESFDTELVTREVSILKSMQHPNCVLCLSSFIVSNELWIVSPREVGSLLDILRHSPAFQRGFLTEHDPSILVSLLRDIVAGLDYCHQNGRLHRDVKAANILLSQDGRALLSDFGVSGAIIEGGIRRLGRNTFTGSLQWMAPEILNRESAHGYPADVWSLGITALELAFGKPPHFDQTPVKVMLLTLQQDPPTIAGYYAQSPEWDPKAYAPKSLRKLEGFIGRCLKKNPRERATAKELASDSLFKLAKPKDFIVESVLSQVVPSKVDTSKVPESKKRRMRDERSKQLSEAVNHHSHSRETRLSDFDFDVSLLVQPDSTDLLSSLEDQGEVVTGRFTVSQDHSE